MAGFFLATATLTHDCKTSEFPVSGCNAATRFTLKLHRGDGMAMLAMNGERGEPPLVSHDLIGPSQCEEALELIRDQHIGVVSPKLFGAVAHLS